MKPANHGPRSYWNGIRFNIEARSRTILDSAFALPSYRRTFKNYVSAMYHVRTNRYPFHAVIRATGRTVIVPSRHIAYQITKGLFETDYNPETGLVSLNVKGRPYFFSGALENGDLLAVFARREYSFLQEPDQIVIDIGANIGDSAIYFAANGARHVYALEPFPSAFAHAKKNVEINDLKEKITIVNAGISAVDGHVTIDPEFKGNTNHEMMSFRSGIRVPVLSLKKLISDYQVTSAVLKMDCEGSEYSCILSSTPETLRTFRKMQIEYHYGTGNLVEKLRNSGFTVSSTRERHVFNRFVSDPHMSIGYIFATRNSSN
jgi:FkbM family methyltransferase